MDEKQLLARGICSQIYKTKCRVCNFECKWYQVASSLINEGLVQVIKKSEETPCNTSLT